MQYPLDDFQKKLSAIGPYKQVDSPPSHSKSRDIPTEKLRISPYNFKLPDLIELAQELSASPPLHKHNSEQTPCIGHDFHLQELSEANHKKINSIYSTIDILFTKIQKIKQEFSYAMPSPCAKLSDYKAVTDSQERQDLKENNKENTKEEIPIHVSEFQHNNTHKKKLQRIESLPLQQHAVNLPLTKHFSQQNQNIFSVHVHHQQANRIKISDFHLGKCMGSGKFGDVYFCVHKATGFVCAIKKIFKSTISEYHMQEQLTTQLKIHYFLDHPNIVKLYAHFDDQYHIFLVMQLATQDTLMKKLNAQQREISQYIQQTVCAVQHMHQNRIVHRDIKPENIVLSFGTVKLCDFGWAAIMDNTMKHSFCGTLDYVSPQMKDVGQYNQSVDLWSIGILTFELLAGFPPYKHQITHWRLKGSKRKMKWNWEVLYPPQISFISKMFIQGLLKQNPSQRLSLLGCQNSLFFRNHREGLEDYLEQDCWQLIE